jgi:hypothetical protein
MAVRSLPNFDIMGITTPQEGLALIRANLIELRIIAGEADFTKREEVRAFDANLAFLKQYYERVDFLLAAGEAS